jgi:hypothetical protein
MADWIDAVVASAMTEVQRNAVPVINQLLREAQERPQSEGNNE